MNRLATIGALTTALLAAVSFAADEKQLGLPQPLGLHQLIVNEAVQADLKMTDEQKKACAQAAEEARKALEGVNQLKPEERGPKFREAREKVEAALKKALKEEQLNRLNQIDYRQRGPSALTQREVAEKLELSREQRQKLGELSREAQQAIQKAREDTTGAERREKIAKLRAGSNEKILELLTDAQKKKWSEMLGSPFDLQKLQPRQ